jgi:hypothetical protein
MTKGITIDEFCETDALQYVEPGKNGAFDTASIQKTDGGKKAAKIKKKRAKSFFPPQLTNLHRYSNIIVAKGITIDEFCETALQYVKHGKNGAFGTESIQKTGGKRAAKIKRDCANPKFRSLLDRLIKGMFSNQSHMQFFNKYKMFIYLQFLSKQPSPSTTKTQFKN